MTVSRRTRSTSVRLYERSVRLFGHRFQRCRVIESRKQKKYCTVYLFYKKRSCVLVGLSDEDRSPETGPPGTGGGTGRIRESPGPLVQRSIGLTSGTTDSRSDTGDYYRPCRKRESRRLFKGMDYRGRLYLTCGPHYRISVFLDSLNSPGWNPVHP